MSRNNSTHFPTNTADIRDTPVMLPPGRAKLATIPVSTGSAAIITMGISRVACFAARAHWDVERYDHIDLEPHRLRTKRNLLDCCTGTGGISDLRIGGSKPYPGLPCWRILRWLRNASPIAEETAL